MTVVVVVSTWGKIFFDYKIHGMYFMYYKDDRFTFILDIR
jgi:hypothetical protein